MATKVKTDGTIYQFLSGSHSFQGVWFGEPHPDYPFQKLWWRKFLPKAKPVVAWAVFDTKGNVLLHTIKCTRKISTSKFTNGSSMKWKECRRHGWRCRKVQITEVVK